MECTLATLIACFHLSGLYVDTGLSYQDSGVEQVTDLSTYRWIPGDQDFEIDRSSHRASLRADNPYGRLALGYALDFRRVSLSLEVAHVSSLATADDRGVNSVQLRARWYPLRH